MKRGQAFETMMLVISVIVALAILGVLTGIIGNLQFGASSSPQEAMHDQLKNIANAGYGYSEPVKVVLKKGIKIDQRSVLKSDLSLIDYQAVTFCIDTGVGSAISTGVSGLLPQAGVCGASQCKVTASTSPGASIGPANQEIAGYFVVCGDSNVGSRGGYRIALSTNAKGASNACVIPTSGC